MKLSKDITDAIIADFFKWSEAEAALANATTDSDNTVIYTLRWFNLGSLNSEAGINVMKELLNKDNVIQGTAGRMTRFVASCCLKYGEENVKLYKNKCYDVLKNVYSIPQATLDMLTEINPCMWMCVMFTII